MADTRSLIRRLNVLKDEAEQQPVPTRKFFAIGNAGVIEDVVGVVVVDGRNFADKDVAAFAPEGMPMFVGHQGDALAGLQLQLAAGRQGAEDAVGIDRDAPQLGNN